MSRLEIIGLRRDLEALTAFLQEQGVLHVEQVPLAVENAPHFLHRVHLSDEQKAEAAALEKLDEMLREIQPLLTARPLREEVEAAAERLAEGSDREWRRVGRQWSRALRSMSRRRVNIQDNLEVLSNYRRVLRTLESIPQSQEAVLGKNARAVMLHGEGNGALASLRRRLEVDLGLDCGIESQRLNRNTTAALIRHAESAAGAVGKALEEEGVSPVDIAVPELRGLSLSEMLTRIDEEIEEHRDMLAGVSGELDAFSQQSGANLVAMGLAVANRLKQLRILDHFAVSDMVAVVHGWSPAEATPAFKNALEERFNGTAVASNLPAADVERKRIPTLLQNQPPAKPFEVLLSLFKPAAYGAYDPTVVVGVFFVFFYGFILGDVAYGLALFGLGYFFKRKFGHIDVVRAIALVAMYCGVSAAVFGFLFGEFLGDVGHRYLHMPQLWFHRGHDTGKLLSIAVAIGVIHIVLSLLLAIREGMRHRDHRHTVEKLGLLLGLAAVGVGVAGYAGAWPFGGRAALFTAALLIILSVLLLIRSTGALAPVGMLEVVSLVSNILSYSRLMALGLASVILADIANEMGGKAGNVVLGIVLAGLLHVVNLAIGIFSPTLHSLRLNYVEFLPKFYSPEGRPYTPFRKETLW